MLADPAQVEQALFNLTNNAVHALGNALRAKDQAARACLALRRVRLGQRFDTAATDSYIASVPSNSPGHRCHHLERVV